MLSLALPAMPLVTPSKFLSTLGQNRWFVLALRSTPNKEEAWPAKHLSNLGSTSPESCHGEPVQSLFFGRREENSLVFILEINHALESCNRSFSFNPRKLES